MGIGPLNDLFDAVLWKLVKTTPDQFAFKDMPLSDRKTTCKYHVTHSAPMQTGQGASASIHGPCWQGAGLKFQSHLIVTLHSWPSNLATPLVVAMPDMHA